MQETNEKIRIMPIPENITALLFDLDGVILDTEAGYTEFWKTELFPLLPKDEDIFSKVKGATLKDILDRYFPSPEMKNRVISLVDNFEARMSCDYVPGAAEYLAKVKSAGYKTALVTSSSQKKMARIYSRYPGFREQFDVAVTADDVIRSKPDPYCYQLAAGKLNVPAEQCCVFEDSMLGLKAGKAAGMFVVGLSTTNPREMILPLSNMVIGDFTEML